MGQGASAPFTPVITSNGPPWYEIVARERARTVCVVKSNGERFLFVDVIGASNKDTLSGALFSFVQRTDHHFDIIYNSVHVPRSAFDEIIVLGRISTTRTNPAAVPGDVAMIGYEVQHYLSISDPHVLLQMMIERLRLE